MRKLFSFFVLRHRLRKPMQFVIVDQRVHGNRLSLKPNGSEAKVSICPERKQMLVSTHMLSRLFGWVFLFSRAKESFFLASVASLLATKRIRLAH